MNLRRAKVVLTLAPVFAACLPEPAPKAEIAVNVRGSLDEKGGREFRTSDGYTVRFERRIISVEVDTTDRTGGYPRGRRNVRNLDVPPFSATPVRAIGERYLALTTAPHYGGGRYVQGPGVTPLDLDRLDGDRSNGSRVIGGVSSILLEGSLEKDGRRWTFEFRVLESSPVVCGLGGGALPAPFLFVSESEHTAEVVIHTERLFASNVANVASKLVAADIDRDRHVALAESDALSSVAGQRIDQYSLGRRIYEVFLDGVPLACTNGGNADERPPTSEPDFSQRLPDGGQPTCSHDVHGLTISIAGPCNTANPITCAGPLVCHAQRAPTPIAQRVDAGGGDASSDADARPNEVADYDGICLEPRDDRVPCDGIELACGPFGACLVASGICLTPEEVPCVCSRYSGACR